jgi:branched-chain amino acid transport system substrate-binding protein
MALAAVSLAAVATGAMAQKKYDPGADDKEIKVGAIHPYSGPASAYGAIGKAIGAYFDKVNAEGGINGRKIKYVPVDDGYNPAKAVEMARKLVEEEEVLLVFNSLGTPSNTAIQKYMNQQKVPQLFVATGATKWGDPKDFPWTMGWQPNYQAEGRIYAQHILETKPGAKVAVLFQNDDYGKDYLKGLEDGLGDKAKAMIVSKVSYEVTDPTIDSQMLTLKASGADTFFNVTTPKFAAQAIKKAAELGWKPTHYLNNVSVSVGSVLTPAGLDNSTGLITTSYLKDPTDPQWSNDKGMQDWRAWLAKYMPDGNAKDVNIVFGYNAAQGLVQVLKQCGDNLTRANVMKQAASLEMNLPLLLPGVNVKTGPDDFFPIEREQLARFDGKTWVLFGKVYGR